jgi:ABC-type transport system substrate-binding protein
MQCRTGELRQDRKVATVTMIRMCRRVPGHFFFSNGTFDCCLTKPAPKQSGRGFFLGLYEIEKGLNNISYRNDRVDELAATNKQIIDQDERAAVIGEIYEILAEEQPYTFLYYPEQHILLSNRVEGFTHHPRVNMYKLNEWYVTE